jgi:hypothetical protein
VREAEGVFDSSARLGALAQNHTWWPMVPFLALAISLYFIGKRGKAAAP